MKLRISNEARAEALFNKYEKLALGAAAAVSRRTGVAYSELQDEALSLLGQLVLERWDGFDSTKARASTWIYKKVYHNLQNFLVARGKRIRREGTTLHEENEPEQKRSTVERLLEEVGDEGWALLRIMFEAPGDLALSLNPAAPTRSINAINRFLTDGCWKPETIDRAWEQVEYCLTAS